jgi:hypothetical protein
MPGDMPIIIVPIPVVLTKNAYILAAKIGVVVPVASRIEG